MIIAFNLSGFRGSLKSVKSPVHWTLKQGDRRDDPAPNLTLLVNS